MSTAATPAIAPVPAPAVSLTGVGKRFDHDAPLVLDGLDLRIAAGEFVCLIGASGCGKSTILDLIAGLTRPSAGEVEVPGGRVAMMFQDPALLPWLSARHNVELALRWDGVPRAQRRERAERLLETVSLTEAARRRPHQLSGGMRQRVALARALAQDRPVLVMDEPFAAVDAITRHQLHGELERIWRDTGRTVVFVTHSVREALRLGQRVLLIGGRPGRAVAEWAVPEAVRAGRDPLAAAALDDDITARLRREAAGDEL